MRSAIVPELNPSIAQFITWDQLLYQSWIHSLHSSLHKISYCTRVESIHCTVHYIRSAIVPELNPFIAQFITWDQLLYQSWIHTLHSSLHEISYFTRVESIHCTVHYMRSAIVPELNPSIAQFRTCDQLTYICDVIQMIVESN